MSSPEPLEEEGEKVNFVQLTCEHLAEAENRVAEDKAAKKKESALEEGQPGKKEDEVEEATDPDYELETGNNLPFSLRRRFPVALAGKPLKEIDPFYESKQTFVVINQRRKIFRFGIGKVLWFMDPLHIVRRFALAVVTHPIFTIVMNLIIIANCLMLMCNENEAREAAKRFFTSLYTVEFILYILAKGFVLHPFSYLRDPWHWFDLFILILDYINCSYLPMRVYVGVLRGVRLMRLMGTTTAAPNMKNIVEATYYSSLNLRDAFIVATYPLVVFAFVGLQTYMGVLTQNCVENIPHHKRLNMTRADIMDHEFTHLYYADGSPEPFLCGNSSGSNMCPDNYTCLQSVGNNPNYGYTNFDTYGWSLFSTFRLMTLDFWEDLMIMIIKAVGPWHVVFFILLVFFCRYFVSNLILVILTMSYGELITTYKMRREMEEAQAFEAQKSALAEFPEEAHEDNRVLDHTVTTPVLETEDEKDWEKKKVPTSACSRFLQRFCLWECSEGWKKCQGILKLVAYDAVTELFLAVCIIISTIILAMDHHGMTPEEYNFVYSGTNVFAFIFAIEVVVKLVASSPYYFFQEWRNVFEFVVLLVTIPVLFVEHNTSLDSLFRLLGLLRAFRLFRIFRTAKASETFLWFTNILRNCLFPFAVLLLFFFIVAFMFSVMGVELFGEYYEAHKYKFYGSEIPRWNLVDFMRAFMVVFRAICGEWIETMWDCMLVAGWMTIPYFLGLAALGNAVIVVMFFAVVYNEKDCRVPVDSNNDVAVVVGRLKRSLCGPNAATIIPEDVKQTNGAPSQEVERPGSKSVASVDLALEEVADNEIKSPSSASSQKLPTTPANVTGSKKDIQNGDHASGESADKGDITSQKQDQTDATTDDEVTLCCPDVCYGLPGCCNYSAWRPWTRSRQLAGKLINNRIFQIVLILCVITSMIVLAFEDVNLEKRPNGECAVKIIVFVLEMVFLVEMLLKWLALGFKNYFTSGWCWLEFTMIVISLAIFGSSTGKAAFVVKAFQSLRPLRLLPRLHTLRVNTTALVRCIPDLLCCFLFCFIIWVVFSIIGVQLFGGKFFRCVDSEGSRLHMSVVANRTHCEQEGTEYSWMDAEINFNNVGSGFLALLEIATLKGWIQIIHDAMDTRHDRDLQPSEEGNIYMFFYFVIFTVVGCFFTFNLIITVVVSQFLEQKKKLSGSLDMFMTEVQRNYFYCLKEMGKVKPRPPVPTFCCKAQAIAYRIISNRKFDLAITIWFTLNLVVLACDHYTMGDVHYDVVRVINYVFLSVYVFECFIKIMGLGLQYFKDGWNVFDLIVVILAVIEAFIGDVMAMYFIGMPILLRLIKVLRVEKVKSLLRCSRYFTGVRTILTTLGASLPGLLNIALLQFIVTYVYTLFGVYLFKHIKLMGLMDDIINFRTFGSTITLLFQISTTAGWDGLLRPLANEEDCTAGDGGDCSNAFLGTLFTVSYILIMFLIIVQLYIAVIIECHNQVCTLIQEGLTTDDYENFYDVWQKYDPNGTQFIKCEELNNLVDELKDPFHISKPNKYKIVNMSIPIYEGNVVYAFDIMDALTKDFLARRGEDIESLVQNEAGECPRGTEVKGKKIISSTLWNQREECSAQVIQRNWNSYRNNKTDEFEVVPTSPGSKASVSKLEDDSKLIEIA